ncbi:ABC transporter [Halobacteriales archaeon QS_4_62_28]|nr:MAG: ABC transporter [Halobacteriales archaeon QS_4_62_28]
MIDVENVSVSLAGVDVLEDVSLAVDTGEFVGLVGPNGAGKTTLLRTVNGAITPDQGVVRVDGESIAALSSRAGSRRVATVPQDTSVRFAFSVEDIVAMGRTPHRDRFRNGDASPDQHYVERALERTATTDLRDRRVSTLSGGERQRVFVARALAQDAPALVLDEPTASLDVNHATRTLSLVRDLVDDGRAVLGAIHDLEAAARFCDRLVLLTDGGVLAAGSPDEVLTAETLAATFDIQGVVSTNPVTGTPSVTTLPATAEESRRIHVLGGGSVGAQIIARLCAAGHDVSAGPYADGDAVLSVTAQFDVPTATVPPLTDPSEQVLDVTRDRIEAADATVLADISITPSGHRLDLATEADRLVAVEEQPLSTRNYAGEQERERYEKLVRNGYQTDVRSAISLLETRPSDPVKRVSRHGI